MNYRVDGKWIIEVDDVVQEYVQSVYDDIKDADNNDFLKGYRIGMEFMALQLGIPLFIKRD